MNDVTAPSSEDTHVLKCMEIWGGNRSAFDAISTPGIDAWVYSRPYEEAEQGGDVHYVSACMAGRIARFVLADVAGHGEVVSGFASSLRRLMRQNINTPDQTRFAQRLNRAFTELNTGGVFATAVVGSYFAPTKQLILCNAGHPHPLWRSSASGRWLALRPDVPGTSAQAANLPLGVIEPTEYHQFAIELAEHDLVLLYTDSLPEARAPDGRMLGEEGLIGLVEQIDPGEPDRFVQRLVERVRGYTGGAMPDDDMTILLLHHNGAPAPSLSLGEKMAVVGKLLGIVPV